MMIRIAAPLDLEPQGAQHPEKRLGIADRGDGAKTRSPKKSVIGRVTSGSPQIDRRPGNEPHSMPFA
jgi:hypothetical protein